MTDKDFGWLCGLLEGEGCFSHLLSCGVTTVRVGVKSTDKDVVERFARLADAPGVHPSRSVFTDSRGVVSRKQAWSACVTGYLAVELMKLVLPEMGQRRSARIKQLLGTWASRPHRKSSREARRANQLGAQA